MSRVPYWFYKMYNFLYRIKIPILPQIFMYLNRIVWGAYIPASCKIGKGIKFGYGGSGVIIYARAVIGDNTLISSCVTISGTSKIYNVPIIGDNVFLGGGCKVLGDIKVGNNVIVGANAVVLSDVPDNCIVAGIPAKIIKTNIKVQDYV